MKEIISAVLFIVSLWGGTLVLKGIHDGIRKAALEKAAQGMPSLTGLAGTLTSKKPSPAQSAKHPSLNPKIQIESPQRATSN